MSVPIVKESVASSSISAIGYDEASETLEVDFLNGSTYQYYNVPAALFEQFRVAPSKVQFFEYDDPKRLPLFESRIEVPRVDFAHAAASS
jgi:KTSC domain